MVRSSKFLPVIDGSQIQLGSRRVEAAISLYKALKVYPSPEQLIVIYGQTVPKPVFDIILAMIFLDPDTYSHKSPGRRPTDLETREAYILQEMERGDSLCRDGSFIRIPSSDRWLTDPTRIEENRSSNILLQRAEGVPVTRRPDRYLQ